MGAVVLVASIVVGAVGLLSELNIDLTTLSADPLALSNMDWQQFTNFDIIWDYLAIILESLVALFIFVVIAAIFHRKSLTSLSEKKGVGLFGTSGLIVFIGAVLTIIAIGFLLLGIALILLNVAFFSIRTEPTPLTPSAH